MQVAVGAGGGVVGLGTDCLLGRVLLVDLLLLLGEVGGRPVPGDHVLLLLHVLGDGGLGVASQLILLLLGRLRR